MRPTMSQSEFISAILKIIGIVIIIGSVFYTVYECNEIRNNNATIAEMKVTIERIKSQYASESTRDIYNKIDIPMTAKSEFNSFYNLSFSVLGILLMVGSKRIANVVSDK